MEPPRFRPPTTTRPPRRLLLMRALHIASRAAMPRPTAGLAGVVGPKLDRELVLPRIAVADQLPGPRIEVGLGVLHRLGERLRGWPVQDSHAAAWAFRDLDPIKPRALVLPAGADRPDLTGGQGIAADMVFALQFGRDDELLNAVLAHRVAELRVAELGGPDPLLLFLDPAAAFQGQPDGPFQVFVGDRIVRARDESASAGR